MRHSSIKQQSVAKKEPQSRQHLIAVHESKKKFVKLCRSVRLQIKALNKDSPHGDDSLIFSSIGHGDLFLSQIYVDIPAITHSAQWNIELSMTKWWWGDIEKNFDQCLRLTFVICHGVCQTQRKLQSCKLEWLPIG